MRIWAHKRAHMHVHAHTHIHAQRKQASTSSMHMHEHSTCHTPQTHKQHSTCAPTSVHTMESNPHAHTLTNGYVGEGMRGGCMPTHRLALHVRILCMHADGVGEEKEEEKEEEEGNDQTAVTRTRAPVCSRARRMGCMPTAAPVLRTCPCRLFLPAAAIQYGFGWCARLQAGWP